ncbi:MAG: 30S ribosomal protein S8 [Myxococcota bacterium]
MVSDPIADMLTRIRNGQTSRLARVDIPKSKIKVSIAEILKTEGFIEDFRVISDKKQGLIEVKLKYDSNRTPVIQGLKRVSRPGLRNYLPAKEIPKVRNGLGVLIMTTSKGVMTDRAAREANVGGEALAAVW